MCSTHYGSLKVLALSEDRFAGASLGFDRDQLAPTFLLSAGAPGVSGALAAARRYGLPAELVEAAKERMGDDATRLGELVERLEAERERARSQADAVVEERAKVAAARRALEEQQQEHRKRSREQVDKEAKKLMEELQRAREQVRQVEERLRNRRRVSKEKLKGASDTLADVAAKLAPGGELAPALEQEPLPGRPAEEEELLAGVAVYVPSMRAKGEVVEPPRRHKVKVALGRVTVTVSAAELRILDGKPPAASTKYRPIRLDAAADAEVPAMTTDNTLDLRGERVDDALREADKFIDRAMQRGWGNAFFIHGHGTGALRDALRRHFSEVSYVSRHEPAQRRQGGEGVTVIWLDG